MVERDVGREWTTGFTDEDVKRSLGTAVVRKACLEQVKGEQKSLQRVNIDNFFEEIFLETEDRTWVVAGGGEGPWYE